MNTAAPPPPTASRPRLLPRPAFAPARVAPPNAPDLGPGDAPGSAGAFQNARELARRQAQALNGSLRLPQWLDPEAAPPQGDTGLMAGATRDDLEIYFRSLKLLNGEQLPIALKTPGSLAVDATAGCGKTRTLACCLTTRVALGANPRRCAVSSYMVSAAEEIAQRTRELVAFFRTGEKKVEYRIEARTLHAIGLHELQNFHHPKGGWHPLEEARQRKLWHEALQFYRQERGETLELPGGLTPETLCQAYDRLRNGALTPAVAAATLEALFDCPEARELALRYERIKASRQYHDYTDLLWHWYVLSLSDVYQGRWQVFIVDEFQDTSALQLLILEALKAGGADVIVCGDLHQSIASYNGADTALQKRFMREVIGEVHRLSTNYRSTAEIIALANAALRQVRPETQNQLQPRPDAPPGIPTVYRRLQANPQVSGQQGWRTALNLYHSLREVKEKPAVAILYRTNGAGDELEPVGLQLAQDPDLLKKVLRGDDRPMPPFQRHDSRKTGLKQETEEVLCDVLALWDDPAQFDRWQALLQSRFFPGIGDKTAHALELHVGGRARSAKAAKGLFRGQIPDAAARSAQTLGLLLDAWEALEASAQVPPTPPPAKGAKGSDAPARRSLPCRLAAQSLGEWLRKANAFLQQEPPRSQKVAEQLPDVLGFELNFVHLLSQQDRTVEEFLKGYDAKRKALAGREESFHGITLSTFHMAKGLEYDGVVLYAIEPGNLPHRLATAEDRPHRPSDFTVKAAVRLVGQLPAPTPEAIQNAVGRARALSADPAERQAPELDDLDPVQEELRLFYVGITRAREELVLLSRSNDHPFLPRETAERLFTQQPLLDAVP